MTPEGKVKLACKALLKSQGWWFYMPSQNGLGVVGIPDIIACRDGQFLAVETKAPGKLKNTTPNQDRVLGDIAAHGGWAVVVDDVAQLEKFLHKQGVADA